MLELQSGDTTPVFRRREPPHVQHKAKQKHLGVGTLSRKQGLHFQFDPHKLQSLKKHCKVTHPEDKVSLNVYCELEPTGAAPGQRGTDGTKL